MLLGLIATVAQDRQAPGKPIGSVSTRGDLIVLTLDDGALGRANLFDLAKHTLRFSPDEAGYRVENTAFAWDSQLGTEVPGRMRTQVPLHAFAFPFSGKKWDSLTLETTGSIGFGAGVTIGRFDQLQNAAKALINKTPAICVFMKPRMSGQRYVKELPDRLVGMVVVVEHGKKPSRELLERANGIRGAWIDYFATATGHRASMTATLR